MIPIIIGILVFGVLILVHEAGHFAAARRNGITVLEFAIGMGPKLFGVTKGDTLYSLRAIPLGGFCRMLGDASEGDDNSQLSAEGALNTKPVWRRVIVFLAGSGANFALAFVLFTLAVSLVTFTVPVVNRTIEGMPAEAAGLLPGDRITRIDKTAIRVFNDVTVALARSEGAPMNVSVVRDGRRLDITITPVDIGGGVYRVGFEGRQMAGLLAPNPDGLERAGLFRSVSMGFWEGIRWINMTFFILGDLLSPAEDTTGVDQLAGPIGVVNFIGEAYEAGAANNVAASLMIHTLLLFSGILSISIAIFNLLPIPALDGGRVVFLLIEGIRRKPIPPEKEGMIHFVGFMALIALAIFVAYNDIVRIITS